MISPFKLACSAIAVAGLSALVVTASETRYRVIDLGTLGSSHSFAAGVNDFGHVVGSSGLDDTISPRPFLYDAGIGDLGSAAGQKGRALAINDRGQIVGDAQTVTPEGYDAFRAFLFENDVMTDLGTLGGISSQALGINDSGQIVGWSEFVPPPVGPWVWPANVPIDQRQHAFFLDVGIMHDLHELAGLEGDNSAAIDINDFGQIIGHDGWRGFLYQDGHVVDLGMPGGIRSVPLSINNSGAIVMFVEDESRNANAFLYDDGEVTELGALGGTQSVARDISDLGTIVGQATLSEVSTIGTPIWHAFVYEGGLMTDLNTLISENSGWVLEDAAGINASGQIVGTGSLNGESRAYLLSPFPEPSTLSLVAASVVVLAWRFLRSRATVG